MTNLDATEATWTCGGCGTGNDSSRAACLACDTSSPTATPESLADTALADAAAARAAQVEEASRGNRDIAEHLSRVVDIHLDDALALQTLTSDPALTAREIDVDDEIDF